MSASTDTARRYTFRHRLGVGGFGEVYRATLHTGAVETDVAVKLLRKEFTEGDGQAARRLKDEARFLAALRHPSVVRVIDLVQLDSRLALVTEFLDGEDLRWILQRDGPISVRAAVEILARVADALHAAATTPSPETGEPMQMIHRDVKPANVHIGTHGAVTLLDFGIARTDTLDREAETEAYAILGSGTYSPPESLMREEPSGAGDVWSLAVTAFEALSGERMFPGMSLQDIARLVVRGDPRGHVLYRLDAMDLPEPVHELLADMLEIEPEDRPAPMDVMRRADDLLEKLEGQPLRRWALERSWNEPDVAPAPLDGQILVEETVGFTGEAPTQDTVNDEETTAPAAGVLGSADSLRPPTVTPPPARKREEGPRRVAGGFGNDEETVRQPVIPPKGGSSEGGPWNGLVLAVLLLVLLSFALVIGLATGWIGGKRHAEDVPLSVIEPTSRVPATAAPEPAPKEPVDDASGTEDPNTDEAGAEEGGPDDGATDAGTEPDGDAGTAPAPRPSPSPTPRPRPKPTPTPGPAPAPAPAPAPSPAPAPAPAPAPTTAPEPGAKTTRLTVTANRRAIVSVDGKPVGYTPTTVELSPGSHTVTAMLPGQPASRKEQTVKAKGSKDSVRFEF